MNDTLEHHFEQTWEIYTSSWKAKTAAEKRNLFEKSLDQHCEYSDPLTITKNWDELLDYMVSFHQQIPGGYFDTYYFLAHNGQSIAKWKMKSGDDTIIGEGVSYGQYNKAGKLTRMTGFYPLPGQ